MRKIIVTCLLAVGFSASVQAADNGIYVGGALSRSTIETEADFFGFGFEDDDTGYKLIGGIRPFDALAFEANYVDFGSITFDDTAADGFRGELETEALDVFAVGFLGVLPMVDAYGKIGAIAWDAESTLQGGLQGIDLRDTEDGVDLAWGAGVQGDIGSLAIRLEYENFDIGEADSVEMWSLGMIWTFF
ncbi:MAG: outer membrane beta-barrel protein [Woeseiaceae bacterium]|nr:outer membrane beta-barrel protein [Woeseiaceae bacterium]